MERIGNELITVVSRESARVDRSPGASDIVQGDTRCVKPLGVNMCRHKEAYESKSS